MAPDIVIKQFPVQSVLLVSKHVKMADVAAGMGDGFAQLMHHATATGAHVVGPPFSLYPEMPGEEFTFLVGMPVAPGAVAADGVQLEELPAVEGAALLYTGPYTEMGPAWQRVLDWVHRSGRQPGGPMREVYLSDPGSTPPQELLTELIVPLA